MLMLQVVIKDWFAPAGTFPELGILVNVLLKNVFVLTGVLLFVVLIFGGLKLMIGIESGDKQGAGEGKNAITAALVGLITVFTAYWLIQIIEYLTGLKIFDPKL